MAGLPSELMRKVGKGELTMKEAWQQHKAEDGSSGASSPVGGRAPKYRRVR